MKIFDLEYYISSFFRRVRVRFRKAVRRREISGPLFLRYLSVLVISYNLFFVARPLKKIEPAVGGDVLSESIQDLKSKDVAPVRIEGTDEPNEFLAKAALIMDATSSAVLFEKNKDFRLPPASLTKMMTALLTLENKKLTEEIIVSQNCTEVDGLKIGFKAGQRYSVENMLYALLLPSASDAACVLSENVFPEASASAQFIVRMNQRAKDLGLSDTNYTNPTGLDGPNGDHYSTAADLLSLTREVLKNEDFRKVVSTRQKKIGSLSGQETFLLKTTNELLLENNGFSGVKTGSTPKALGCLSFLFERDGHQIIGVILGSDDRFKDAKNLVNWVLESYRWPPSN